MKYAVLFVVVIAVLLLIKRGQRQRARDVASRSRTRPTAPEPMHACGHCGVHVPASRCVWKNGSPYCCDDHARLG